MGSIVVKFVSDLLRLVSREMRRECAALFGVESVAPRQHVHYVPVIPSLTWTRHYCTNRCRVITAQRRKSVICINWSDCIFGTVPPWQVSNSPTPGDTEIHNVAACDAKHRRSTEMLKTCGSNQNVNWFHTWNISSFSVLIQLHTYI